jgi:hypothetical protein
MEGYNEMVQDYQLRQHEARVQRNQGQIEAFTQHSVAGAELRHNPIEAIRARLLGDFRVATAGLTPGSEKHDEAVQKYQDDSKVATQRWNEDQAFNSFGLQNRGRALAELLKATPNVIGAESISAGGAAIQQAMAVFSDRGGTKEGREQIAQIGANAVAEQQLIKRDYLDSFRARQFDPINSVANPRDQEDIGASIKSVNDEVKEIKDAIIKLLP